MGEKIAKLGIKRDNDMMYYIKTGDVWVIPANTPHGGQFEDAPQVLFISSPIDDPDNQDRVWLD